MKNPVDVGFVAGLVVGVCAILIGLFYFLGPEVEAPGCYDTAIVTFWNGLADIHEGADIATVEKRIAAAVAFDPELATLWNDVMRGADGEVFLARLQAKAWLGKCPKIKGEEQA